jgi:hypothetical protein
VSLHLIPWAPFPTHDSRIKPCRTGWIGWIYLERGHRSNEAPGGGAIGPAESENEDHLWGGRDLADAAEACDCVCVRGWALWGRTDPLLDLRPWGGGIGGELSRVRGTMNWD